MAAGAPSSPSSTSCRSRRSAQRTWRRRRWRASSSPHAGGGRAARPLTIAALLLRSAPEGRPAVLARAGGPIPPCPVRNESRGPQPGRGGHLQNRGRHLGPPARLPNPASSGWRQLGRGRRSARGRRLVDNHRCGSDPSRLTRPREIESAGSSGPPPGRAAIRKRWSTGHAAPRNGGDYPPLIHGWWPVASRPYGLVVAPLRAGSEGPRRPTEGRAAGLEMVAGALDRSANDGDHCGPQPPIITLAEPCTAMWDSRFRTSLGITPLLGGAQRVGSRRAGEVGAHFQNPCAAQPTVAGRPYGLSVLALLLRPGREQAEVPIAAEPNGRR